MCKNRVHWLECIYIIVKTKKGLVGEYSVWNQLLIKLEKQILLAFIKSIATQFWSNHI